MIWIVLAALTVCAVLLLGYPFLSNRLREVSRTDGGISVYQHQLKELEADVAKGVLNDTQAESARLEIQRRMLRMAEEGKREKGNESGRMPIVAIALLIAIPAASFSLYGYMGSPELVSKPLASRDIAKEKRDLAGRDLGSLVARLADRLQDNPENLDGWILLARTLSRMEKFEEAANTFLQATKIAKEDADLYVGAGENFYFHAQGVVTEDAARAFESALALDPAHAGSRYYLALKDEQNGKSEQALNSWIALYNDSDADAPYMSILRKRIDDAASKLDRDVASLLEEKNIAPLRQPAPSTQPGPTQEDMQAAANMSGEDRQQMIRQMVGRLAARMEETPEFDGLMRLGQVYGTLGEFENSAAAYGRAAAMDENNPTPLTRQALALVQNEAQSPSPPAKAISLYRKVLEMDENAPEALWYVGIAEAQAGNKGAALKYWERLKTLVPSNSPLAGNVTKAINSLSQGK